MDADHLQRNARTASRLLRALANERRLTILCLLLSGEKSVGELVRAVGLSQSALSQHLARLRRDGLVRTRRSAQTIYYGLAGDDARTVLETLHGLYCAEVRAQAGGHEPAGAPGERGQHLPA